MKHTNDGINIASKFIKISNSWFENGSTCHLVRISPEKVRPMLMKSWQFRYIMKCIYYVRMIMPTFPSQVLIFQILRWSRQTVLASGAKSSYSSCKKMQKQQCSKNNRNPPCISPCSPFLTVCFYSYQLVKSCFKTLNHGVTRAPLKLSISWTCPMQIYSYET